ncbi:MAG: hypothetical protein AAFR35_14650 [Pseudomonadota bacterium]
MLEFLYVTPRPDRSSLRPSERVAFDPGFYTRRNPDIDVSTNTPLSHYAQWGRFEGRRPAEHADPLKILTPRGRAVHERLCALVDRPFYFAQANLSRDADVDPLMHYFAWGHDHGFSIAPDFDPAFYANSNEDVQAHGLDPLVHYAEHGFIERRLTAPDRRLLDVPEGWRYRADCIRPHIDDGHYADQVPWIRGTTVDPASHYLRYGAAAGLSPAKGFDPTGLGPDSGGTTAFERFLSGRRGSGRPMITSATGARNTDGMEIADLWPDVPWTEISARTGFEAGGLSLGRMHPDIESEPTTRVPAPDELGSDLNEPDLVFVERANALAKGKLLSLDMWDTLVRRSVAPDAVKLRTARYLWLTSWDSLPPGHRVSHTDLFQLRRAAEASVADEAGEYRFDEATRRWLGFLGLRDTGLEALLKAKETAFECETASVDPTMAALLALRDQPYILVSDFYHDADTLGKILDAIGAPEPISAYASSDVMATKRQGALFPIVAGREARRPDEILHLGDRKDADCNRARDAGVGAMHFQNPDQEARTQRLETGFWSMMEGRPRTHEADLMDLVPHSGPEDGLPVETLAIVVAGFVLEILETARKLGEDEIFFFSREGLFFREAYDRIAETDVYDLGAYPESRPLYVSRRATFGASVDDPGTQELMRLWSQYSSQSPSAFLISLNCPPADFESAATEAGLDLDTLVEHPWEDPDFIAFLASGDVRDRLRTALWGQRDALMLYLANTGFDPMSGRTRCIVDIGWRGSIQDNLAMICNGSIVGCYLGLERFLNDQSTSGPKSGFAFDLNEEDMRLVHDYAALEFLFNVPEGSVRGYENGTPVRDVIENEEAAIKTRVRPLQERILSTLDHVARYVRRHGLVAADLRPLSRSLLARYFRNPPADVADAFRDLEHNESFGTGTSQRVAEMRGTPESIVAKSGPDLHAGFLGLIDGMRWHESLHAQSRISKAKEALSFDARLNLPTTVFAPQVLRQSRGSAGVLFTAPAPIVGSGGHRTILNAANKVARLGAPVSVMFERFSGQAERDWVAEVADPSVTILDRWDSEAPADIAVATIDYSAAYVNEFYAGKAKTHYFIQDFEAYFNPVSDAYLRAERSYTLTENHFTIGRWLSHRLATEYGIRSAHSGLGVDQTIYRTDIATDRRERIAFLFQPEKPRRAPDLAVEALRQVKARLPYVEIVLFGSDAKAVLPFEATQLGLLNDLDDIAALYRTAKVGLCLSATNPSRIPYEMMACGCVPVDLYRYNNLFDYGPDAGCLAYQSAASLAEAMAHQFEDHELFARRQRAGLSWTAGRSLDWESDVFANQIARILSDAESQNMETPSPTYLDMPVIAHEDDTAPVRHFLDHHWMLACRGVSTPDRGGWLRIAS